MNAKETKYMTFSAKFDQISWGLNQAYVGIFFSSSSCFAMGSNSWKTAYHDKIDKNYRIIR